ncbi:MAG: D-alanine--D-alanine ligase [bacterium]|nr:D-alanine--D-alanine ligase [bacterium]
MCPNHLADPPRKIVLVFGGASPEHEISILSASKVAEGLRLLAQTVPLTVRPLYISREGRWIWTRPADGALPREAEILAAEQWEAYPERHGAVVESFARGIGRLADESPDAALLILHGIGGEDGRLQGALDLAGIPYTGSGAAASALVLNKPRCQAVLNAAGLPIARSILVRAGSEMGGAERILELVGLPCVVKPAEGGSSVGVTIVRAREQLRPALECAFAVDDEVMAEHFVAGRELTCGMLECDGRLVALPVTEIIPPEGRFFDYEAKYQPGLSREVTPAQIDPALATRIQTLARAAHLACGCRGFSRVDFIADPDDPVILEINTIPGMTATSLLPQAAAAIGIGFPVLLGHMLASAHCNGRHGGM